jgi:hypothetical protein
MMSCYTKLADTITFLCTHLLRKKSRLPLSKSSFSEANGVYKDTRKKGKAMPVGCGGVEGFC